MDGENKGKPYFLMDDLGGKNPIFGNTYIKLPSTKRQRIRGVWVCYAVFRGSQIYPWQPLGKTLLKVKLLVGPTCKIPRSTQRSVWGIRRSPKMCQETNPKISWKKQHRTPRQLLKKTRPLPQKKTHRTDSGHLFSNLRCVKYQNLRFRCSKLDVHFGFRCRHKVGVGNSIVINGVAWGPLLKIAENK